MKNSQKGITGTQKAMVVFALVITALLSFCLGRYTKDAINYCERPTTTRSTHTIPTCTHTDKDILN